MKRISVWRARRKARLAAATTRAELPDNGIGAEAPIRTASQDRLRRADFASRIAGVLSELSLREGRVFAIRGGWGFGKSSLKNLVTERLDAREDGADWLDFNPWQWGDGDAISRAMFGQIADRLGGEHSRAAVARANALRRYGAILTGAEDPLKKAGVSTHIVSLVLTNVSVIAVASAVGLALPSAARLAAVLAALSVGVPVVGRALAHLGRDRTSEPLDRIREALETRLRELDRPLVVFVDDIDRLEPDQIRMLLRQVKANANLPNIVFVLLFQPSIVENALEPVADGDGRAFLEKIVQANFDLPAVPVSTVHTAFTEELSRMATPFATGSNGFDQIRWGNLLIGCMQPFLRNMRDARRLLSSIAVHLPLHASGKLFEVNIIDFLMLETLRVFEPDLHAELFRQRELVLQTSRYLGNSQHEADKAAAASLIEIVPAERRAAIKDAIKELFPRVAWAFGGMHYGDGWQENWLAAKRVCSPRFFPRYFELQAAEGELTESAFEAFLDATADANLLSAALDDLEAGDLLRSLVARLDESVDRLPVDNAAVLLPAMFKIGQMFSGARTFDPFNSPWTWSWRAANWYIRRIPEGVRGGLVIDAFRQTNALSIAAMLIGLSDPADQKDQNGPFDPALDLATVGALKAEWVEEVRRRALEPEALAAEPDLVRLLYRWRRYVDSTEEPRAFVHGMTRTDEGFAIMADRLMSRGMSQGMGDHVGTPHNSFDRETVDTFIGVNAAKARLEAIDLADHPVHEEALQTMLRHVDLWLGLRERELQDW